MAVFEIINPSDPYTLKAESLDVAAIAVILMGQGKYCLKEIGGEREVPFFMFGGADKWFQDNFGKTVEECFDSVDKKQLIACLKSVALPNGKHKSSLNDIGGRAKAYAKAIAAK